MGDTPKFTPTPKMIDYLDAWCEPGLKQTLASMCEKAGVSRRSVYDWYHDVPEFAEWFNTEYAKRRMMRRPGAINAMEAKALEGDVNAYRAWQQTGDDLTYRPGGGLSVASDGPVTIRIARLDEVEDGLNGE